MSAQDKIDDEDDRKESAESLRRQIEDLKAGRAKKPSSPSLRDFIEEKMAEDKKQEGKKPTS